MKPAPTREVRCLDDPSALCAVAADEFVRAAGDAVEARGRFRVALSGGTTPCRLHRLLSESPYREKIAWEKIDFFFGDERAVHPEHAESNYRMACDTLLREVDVAPRSIHRMQAERCDLDDAAHEYQCKIAEAFSLPHSAPPPAFDLIMLGMGADGHTASLFPGTSALAEAERWVVGNEVPQLGTSRMTFTYPLINAARRVVFLLTGPSKAEPVREVIEGAKQPSPYPAQGIQPSPGSLLYLMDAEAGSLLSAHPHSS